MRRASLAYRLSFGLVFLWFLIGGIGHFAATEFFASIVPPYFPMSARHAVLVSGIFELAGVAGLLSGSTRRMAAWGLFLLTICVTPANVYMWQHPALFSKVPESVLLFRLLFQIVLLACIYRCTKPEHSSSNL